MVANPISYKKAQTTGAAAGITHALLAVDGSPASLRAAARLRLMLQAFPEARLTVIYVAHLPRDLQVSGTGQKVIVEFPVSSMVRATSAPVLDAVMKELGPLAVRAETEVQVGEPATEICEFARSESVDLIVMGLKGTGPAGIAMGGVSSKVLALSECPVLLVH
jgi:nucleotide-binding universal stress UspA family protein